MVKTYKDETYWKYKLRDKKIKEKQREKDLLNPDVSFEEYMDKHEKPSEFARFTDNYPAITDDERREFEHDMFRQKREKDKLDEAYLEMLEKINDSQMNMMSSALKLMRKKKEEGEI